MSFCRLDYRLTKMFRDWSNQKVTRCVSLRKKAIHWLKVMNRGSTEFGATLDVVYSGSRSAIHAPCSDRQ